MPIFVKFSSCAKPWNLHDMLETGIVTSLYVRNMCKFFNYLYGLILEMFHTDH